MNISIKELTQLNEIETIVDYFLNSEEEYLKGMGVDKHKLLSRKEWIKTLKTDLKNPYTQKKYYYIIWLVNNKPVGHSNVNQIKFGEQATMHLHLWNSEIRKNGLGTAFLKLTIPNYFEKLKLNKLICEPYAKNAAPNKTLKKFGFTSIGSFNTIPGPINFQQTVNRYVLTAEQLNIIETETKN